MSWAARAIAMVAMLLVAMLVSSCGDDTGAAADPACEASENACVTVGIGEPIYLGTLLFARDPEGRGTRNAIALALDYLDGAFDGRDGEVLGHRVDLINEVEDCTPAGGRAGARRLLTDADIVAVIGTTCSAAAYRAAATVLSPRQVLLVSPTSTSPLLTSPEGRERYFFRTAANDVIVAGTMADFTRTRLRARTAATLATGDPHSSALADAFTTAFRSAGGRVVAQQSAAGSDTLRAARRIASQRPDAIIIPASEPGCSRAVAAVRAQPGLSRTPILASGACMTTSFPSRARRDAHLYGATLDGSGLRRNGFYRTEFLPAYRQRFGSAPSGVVTAPAFDALNLVIAAIRRVAVPLPGGALRINRSDLRAAMLDVDGYEGVSGDLACRASGDCVQSARVSVYRASSWPPATGSPVFSGSRTLSEATNSG